MKVNVLTQSIFSKQGFCPFLVLCVTEWVAVGKPIVLDISSEVELK